MRWEEKQHSSFQEFLMRLTPQIVIESIPRATQANVFRSHKSLPGLIELLDQAVLFHFPNVELKEHVAFAIDLYERGLFQLPFPVTAAAFERDLGPPLNRCGGMMVLSQNNNGTINGISCSEAGDRGKALPIGLVMEATLVKHDDSACDVSTKSTLPIVSDQIIEAMYGRGPAGLETFRHRLINNLVTTMGLIVMLMSKGVATQRIQPSAKLNKARKMRSKPQIRDRYIVTIDMSAARLINNADGSTEDITNHTRGTPRLHWRRGHFRTLARSSAQERIIPVAPCLVGANENAEAVKAKVYQVRQQQKEA